MVDSSGSSCSCPSAWDRAGKSESPNGAGIWSGRGIKCPPSSLPDRAARERNMVENYQFRNSPIYLQYTNTFQS